MVFFPGLGRAHCLDPRRVSAACPTVADPERLTSAGQDRNYTYPRATHPRAGTEDVFPLG